MRMRRVRGAQRPPEAGRDHYSSEYRALGGRGGLGMDLDIEMGLGIGMWMEGRGGWETGEGVFSE